MFTDAARNSMIGALGAVYGSLHTAWSATGANEVSGGSPAYARQPLSWSAPAAGQIALTAAAVFPVPVATVRFVGLWTALTGGTFLGMMANGGEEREFWLANSLAANKILMPGHGYVADQKVVFYGGTPPGGLTEGAVYYVKAPDADGFLLTTAPAGLTITLTSTPADADCVCSAIFEDVFAAQGVLSVPAGASLNLNG